MVKAASAMSRWVLGLVAALALLASPALAHAQACCAGASAITPARLGLHEQALVGVLVTASTGLGSYDAARTFRATPPGVGELDLRQDVVAALRWLERGQLGVLIPLHASWRRSPTTGAELGGGLGDLSLNLRYDAINNREYRYLPGIALLGGVTLATGRPPESARRPLGSDATGTGATQFSVGLALERSFGDFLLNVTGLASKRTRREVFGVDSELGTHLMALFAVGYTLFEETAVAGVLTYTHEGDARIDGQAVPDTASGRLRVSLAASSTISDAWRLQGAAFIDPPLDGLGRNLPSSVGATLGLIWSFL